MMPMEGVTLPAAVRFFFGWPFPRSFALGRWLEWMICTAKE